jgi:hypothetical protein
MTSLPSLPGLSPGRLNTLMQQTIQAAALDLTDLTILTEAASGAYGVTPVIAALAGAKQVYAMVRPTSYGSVAEVSDWTMKIAAETGLQNKIKIIESVPDDILPHVDIVTNSGHLRPITAQMIEKLPARAVIGLMFEAWEFRPQDMDVAACLRRNIPVVGVNERHQAVDVFSYLGPLCVKLLHEAGLPVYRNRIALLCDNEFDQSIYKGLTGLGADVQLFTRVKDLTRESWDAVVVALKPEATPRITSAEAAHIISMAPSGAVVAQFWGDIDRESFNGAKLKLWPASAPRPGHMAILLSAIGPDSVVRLQTGGLKAAEVVFRNGIATKDRIAQVLDLKALPK